MVRFGHDGWFGQLARDMTFDSIESVARAAGVIMVRDYPDDARLVVGFDRRFLSDRFAHGIARELASLGIEVLLIPRPIPVPALSFAIGHVDAVGGIMVTGGTAPLDVNGIKLRGWDGGALPRWMLTQIEELSATSGPLSRVGPTARVTMLDPVADYLAAVGEQTPLRAIRGSGITVAVDSMWGTASQLIPLLTDGDGSRSVEIRSAHNPLFPELQSPGPQVQNLERLRRIVRTGDAALGLAIGADGCSVGLIDENGVPVSSSMLSSLIAWYLLFVKQETGAIARTIAASDGVDRIAEAAGVARHELPVGHTAVCEVLREQLPMLLVDDDGGVVLTDHLFERDAIMAALLVVSLMVQTRTSLSALVEEVRATTGNRTVERSQLTLTPEQIDLVRIRLAREEWPTVVSDLEVENLYVSDGVKLELEAGAWLLIRYDELDGVLQVAAESDVPEHAKQLVQAGRQMMLV